jgi:site-specific DNA-methyltransferase (adenine-specific)
MGYRFRYVSEHLIALQKPPERRKGVWCIHDIRTVWDEELPRVWTEKALPAEKGTPSTAHRKPVGLQQRLIEAVTNPGNVVVDPAAGSYSVLDGVQQRTPVPRLRSDPEQPEAAAADAAVS